MKALFIAFLALSIASISVGQTKKAHAKKPTTKSAPRKKQQAHEPTSHLNATAAGRYAKDFGKKMYYAVDFEQEKGSYSLSINRWKPYTFKNDDGTKSTWYMIDATISWKSSQGGWPKTWNDVEYKGVIMCDEFGCQSSYLIKTKKEPSSKGLAALVVKRSPVGEFDDQHKQGWGSVDTWLDGVNYAWSPEGCLE